MLAAAKRVKPYSDLVQAHKREPLKVVGSQQKTPNFYVSGTEVMTRYQQMQPLLPPDIYHHIFEW